MLVAILFFVAARGAVLHGAALLFVYAIGHCLLILAVGTSIVATPRGPVDLSTWTYRLGGVPVGDYPLSNARP